MSPAINRGAWLLLVAGGMLILANSVDYFRVGDSSQFIEEKGGLAQERVWLLMLYLHVSSGLLALLSSLLQFSRALIREAPLIHRWLGRIYAFTVLGLLCPSGLYLAFSAKGGFLGRLGFLSLGVLTFYFTLQGFLALRGARRDMTRHIAFMIRSFAMLTTAITFRIEHLVFYLLGLDDATNYLVSLWLSIVGNAAVGEWLIRRMNFRHIPTSILTQSELS